MVTSRADDYSWQKEYAPKIGRGYLVFVWAIYLLWMGLMAGIAIHRWFGALQ